MTDTINELANQLNSPQGQMLKQQLLSHTLKMENRIHRQIANGKTREQYLVWGAMANAAAAAQVILQKFKCNTD